MKQPGLPEERAAIRGPAIYIHHPNLDGGLEVAQGRLRRGADGDGPRRFASRDTHARLQQAPVQASRRF